MSFRNEFYQGNELIHLNNAGHAPMTLKAREAIRRIADLHTEQASHMIPALFAELEKARVTLAKFLGAKSSRYVTYTANLATAISQAAWGLPFREGDVILTVDQEYPSNAYAWMAVAKAKNLKLEHFESNADYSIDWDRFLSCIRPGVKAVALSWVQYKAGTTAPLKAISQACHKVGAWFVVDGFQGLGVMPFSFVDTEVDIMCGGSHKWLCGPTGHGFLAFREELFQEMVPVLRGANTFGGPDDPVRESNPLLNSAGRFDAGSPSHLAAIAMATSMEVFMTEGVSNISKNALGLRRMLDQGLRSQGWTVLGGEEGPFTSAIVTFTGPRLADATEELKLRKVSAVLRTHGLRLSPHGFNTKEEIEQALLWISYAK